MGKILVFISLAVTLATAVLGFVNKGTMDAKTESLASATQEVSQKSQALEKASADLKKTTADLTTATTEKEEALSQAKTAQAAMEQAKSKATELETKVTAQTEEVTKLTAEVSAKQAEIDQLKAATTTTSTEPSPDTQAQLLEKETLIAKLQGDLEAAKTAVAEAKKKDEDRQALKMRDGLQGRVLAVNQAWNFVVLNLGDKNGVVSNAEMLVKRGNNLIGKVRITSVEPATSIADIVVSSVPQGVSIAPGDNVIFQAVGE
jgi:DNA repair exonuclease SbcCD ATPase subunit